MTEIQRLKSMKASFNRVVGKITAYNCESGCYSVFEAMLNMIGVPEDIIKDIYLGSGFSDWSDIHHARMENKYSLPVHTSIGKIKGIASAVNQMLDKHIESLHN